MDEDGELIIPDNYDEEDNRIFIEDNHNVSDSDAILPDDDHDGCGNGAILPDDNHEGCEIEAVFPDDHNGCGNDVVLPDFSQVQIEVHASEVAEKIIEHITGNEVFGTEEYLNMEDDVVELSDDYTEDLEEQEKITGDVNEDAKDYKQINNTQDMCVIDEIDITDDYVEDLDEADKIPDKDIGNYDAVIEEYPDYGNVAVKEENYPFEEETDYTNFDASTMEQNSDEIPPEDIYHHNNVIILGSKPCPSMSNSILRALLNDNDEDEIKKEYLDVFVSLEDWGPKLEDSQRFCSDCGTLFGTTNDFDAHKMTAHSFLVPVNRNVAYKSTSKPSRSGSVVVKNNKNIARKSTGSGKIAIGSMFCNHCNKLFPDNDSLIKHLYELLTVKQFNCDLCNIVFKTQKELADHNIVHIKPEKVKVKKEKIDDENGFKKLIKKKKLGAVNVDMQAIPKSVLFQCPKCNVHFVSVVAAHLHNINCHLSVKRKRSSPCDICNRNIQIKDMKIHKLQHKLSSKFRVFKVSKSLSNRTLCKCPNCHVHFSDVGMYMHLKSCGKVPKLHCDKCIIFLSRFKYYTHMKQHTEQQLKPKDFLIISYSIQTAAGKRKLEVPTTPAKKIKLELTQNIVKNLQEIKKEPEVEYEEPIPNKKLQKIKKEPIDHEESTSSKQFKVEPIKKYSHKIKEEPVFDVPIKKQYKGKYYNEDYKRKMFFCRACKGCCFQKQTHAIHLSKQCTTKRQIAQRVICSECGLQFQGIKHHKDMHRRRNIAIRDIGFYDVHTLKRIIPTIPSYPKCNNCKINFFSKKLLIEHICGEDYETCSVCGEKYHNSAYEAHIEFHKLGKKQPMKKIKNEYAKNETKLLPELMKKYQSLNMMWNILYGCVKCDIITDNYDKAVEHSQGHWNVEMSTKNIKCYICNLKFDETSWSKHSELHGQMTITSKDFNILRFNPQKLLTQEWFELFQGLPKDQMKLITEQSLYVSQRHSKLTLIKEGRSEYTIYCCSDCNVAYRNSELDKHVNSVCRPSMEVCRICSIPFSDISTLRNHQIYHMKGVKKDEFRVVMFSKQQIINKVRLISNRKNATSKQASNHKLAKLKLNKIKPQIKIIRKKNNLEMYGDKYVLSKCKKCGICIHARRNSEKHLCNSLKKKCSLCGLFITAKYIGNHLKIHMTKPDFHVSNMSFLMFDPKRQTKQHQTDKIKPIKKKKAVKKKVKNSDKNYTGKVRTATKRKADSSNGSLLSKTATVYKCKCGLHYTSLKTIEKHVETCDSEADISKENCSKCGLLFPTDILVTHLCKHHSKNSKFVVEPYQNIESTSESPTPTKKPRFKSKVNLYKCGQCNVFYVNKNTCYKHAYKNHQPVNPKSCIECKLCGLQFTISTLPIHVTRHHSDYFNLDNVLIEEYLPPSGDVPLKMQRYVAADKVQSLQITSSIEESKLTDS